MKTKEILLPIHALPSNYGVGEFSKEATTFIDLLKVNGVKEWLIFPVNNGDLLNEMYISLDDLFSRELIGKPVSFNRNKKLVFYNDVYRLKSTYYFEAYCNYIAKNGEGLLNDFIKANNDIYQKCKAKVESTNGGSENNRNNLFIRYNCFMQMIIKQEFDYVKDYANCAGVSLKIIDPKDAKNHFSYLELFKINKKIELKNLDNTNSCFKLKNLKKIKKLLERQNND